MRFRADFGRIFPGLILFLVGLVVLVILGLAAVVAFLFSFVAGSGGVLAVLLELTIVPALLIVAGIVTILTGVSWRSDGSYGWISGVARARALEDRMRLSSRVGEVFGVAITLIVFFFLYENQLRGVPFFAPNFDAYASFYFYGPLFTGIVLSLARAAYGHRNGIRPLDAVNALFLVVAAFWLLSVFPFDFTHFGDMFPASIQFVFGWLSNDIGRLLFVLAGIGASINFVYTAVLYLGVRHQLHAMRGAPSMLEHPVSFG
ncbi:MAG TPA: hypothetical protein VJR06_02100 [Nitrososphaerales archaeon]|nr:hypothetical protein [Nitrososphaerales archaeon]